MPTDLLDMIAVEMVRRLADEGVDKQSTEPITITFNGEQSKVLRAALELRRLLEADDGRSERSDAHLITNFAFGWLKTALTRKVREMLSDAHIGVIDLTGEKGEEGDN